MPLANSGTSVRHGKVGARDTAAACPAPASGMTMVASPCINICRMEEGSCVGCLRTLDEIVRWRDMGDTEKRAVLAAIAQRRPVTATVR